jgi:hypothetical protein
MAVPGFAAEQKPTPGITLIRAGINIRGHDVIIQHIHVRMGTAGMAKRMGWEPKARSSTISSTVPVSGPCATTSRRCVVHVGGTGDVELYIKDNIAVDRIGRPMPMLGRYMTPKVAPTHEAIH